jgi:error-prone DNA polymerase
LRETFGVIVYHEQVMTTLAALAGYDLTYADHIRRHLDREDMLPAFREDFLARATARGVDRTAAEQTWADVTEFASFGFCKAHAAAFAVPTYRSSWLKTHYRAHFLAGVLTHDPGMYPKRLLLDDARRAGVPILPLDVNRSEPEYVVEDVAPSASEPLFGIRLALQDVRGISQAEIRSILAARAERPLTSVADVLRRTTLARPVVEALAHAGAFDAVRPPVARGAGPPPSEASPEPGTPAKGRREHLFEAIVTPAHREGDQLTLADAAVPSHRFADYSDAEVVRAELEVLGLDASRHLASFYEELFRDLGVTFAADLGRRRGGQKVMVAGVKVASQTPAVKSGQRIIFLSLDDGTGPLEVTVFESVQPKVARTVFHAYALAVWGELRRTGVKGVSIIAEEVWDLTALHRARADGRLREALAEPSEPHGPVSRDDPLARVARLRHSSGGSAG